MRSGSRSVFAMASLSSVVAISTSSHPFQIQCYGDSLTAGFTDGGYHFHPYAKALSLDLKEKGFDARVQQKGMSGWTAKQLLETASQPHGLGFIMRASKIDLVVLLAGTNDLGFFLDDPIEEPKIIDNIWGLHQLAHLHRARSIAISIPGSRWQESNPRAGNLRQTLNEGLRAKCDSSEGLCTYFECPVTWGAEEKALWEPDGLHFSAQGYDVLGKALAPLVIHLAQNHAPV